MAGSSPLASLGSLGPALRKRGHPAWRVGYLCVGKGTWIHQERRRRPHSPQNAGGWAPRKRGPTKRQDSARS